MTLLDFKPQNAKGHPIPVAMQKCKRPVLEPKFDGWRLLAFVTAAGVRFFTRTGKEYTANTPQPIIDQIAQAFPVGSILDGEIVDLETQDCTRVVNVYGKSKAIPTQEQLDAMTYVVFDLIQLGDEDLTGLMLGDRRVKYQEKLEGLDRVVPTAQWQIDDPNVAEQMYVSLVDQGYEGAMIKDAQAPYGKGKRGHGWFKIKQTTTIDVVVMDFIADGKGQHEGKVGRFVVGQYLDGELVERAKVNPIDAKMRDGMTAALELPPEANPYVGRVLTIKHFGVLKDGLRHPTCTSRNPWREDKPAEDCVFDNGQEV